MHKWKFLPTTLNLNFQNSNSPIMEQLTFFHDHSMIILVIITILVSYLMSLLFINSFTNMYFLSGQMIEIIWTILPAMILLFIAFPSLRILYLIDEINKPLITIKTIGHQWYWKYEYSNFSNIEFDSFMKNSSINSFRLLETDNYTVLPSDSQIRILVSAADVLHSWTIPSLGVKIDAIPGRLNQTNFFLNRKGLFIGQCSEICGANHSFMPILIESTKLFSFLKWLMNN